ncbi:unnamed protein product [Rotaria sp. Silwood2]|nr:unnamed protein product [Rotaria sp. Silwood2]CAF2824712.1 unnamed protein product [Rotaria sp. Silwood2]CAF2985651.1 unnamed protein product [Rotaria sp. Silwood2]
MLRWQHILLCLLILSIKFSSVKPSILSTKFNITLITPHNTSLPTTTPHKSVLVKYKLPHDENQWTIDFSCRSSNVPRLLYGVKKLNSNEYNMWWRMYVIRVRQFRRKLIQLVCDSRTLSNINQSAIEILSPDLFLMKDDYLLIECENTPQASCYFLIYYTYKSNLIKNDNICQKNDFFDLFKLLPSRDKLNTNQSTMKKSSIHGSTIFLLIFILLLIIWISIIIGCIIMRRIRGLVNFRTEPAFPFSSQKYNSTSGARGGNDNYQQRTGDADQIMQIDVEQAGLAS